MAEKVNILLDALKEIDGLSEQRGSQISWKVIYEEVQVICQQAIKKWEIENKLYQDKVEELKKIIEARDNECNNEHYMALNDCINETIKLREENIKLQKLLEIRK